MIEMVKELRTQLLTSSSITAVEPYLRDETKLPAVLYELSQDEAVEELSAAGSNLRFSVVEFRALSEDYGEAESLAAEIKTKVEAKSYDGTPTQSVRVSSFDRAYEMPVDSGNQVLYVVTVSVNVFWLSDWSE